MAGDAGGSLLFVFVSVPTSSGSLPHTVANMGLAPIQCACLGAAPDQRHCPHHPDGEQADYRFMPEQTAVKPPPLVGGSAGGRPGWVVLGW